MGWKEFFLDWRKGLIFLSILFLTCFCIISSIHALVIRRIPIPTTKTTTTPSVPKTTTTSPTSINNILSGSTCSETVSLSLSPSTINLYGSATPSASDLTGCAGKTVYFKEESCLGPSSANVKAAYNFDENSGTIIHDYSSYGNDGTLYNMLLPNDMDGWTESTSNWFILAGSGSVSFNTVDKQIGTGSVYGSLTADTTGNAEITYNPTGIWDLTGFSKIYVWVKYDIKGPYHDISLFDSTGKWRWWDITSSVTAGQWKRYEIDLKSGYAEQTGFNLASVDSIAIKTKNLAVGTSQKVWVDGLHFNNWISGKFGSALNFGRSSNYVDIGNSNNLDFGPGKDFSISAWIKSNDVSDLNEWDHDIVVIGGEYTVVFSIAGKNRPTSWVGKPLFYATNQWDVLGDCMFPRIDDGKWHHVVAVADRDAIATVYVDNIPVAFKDISQWNDVSYGSNGNDFIGGYSVGNPFYGAIDEVRIYNKALTPENVSALYNERNCTVSGSGCTADAFVAPGNSGTYTFYACVDKNSDYRYDTGEQDSGILTVSGASSSGLIGYWKLDEGSGTNIADNSGSGSGKNGVIVNPSGAIWTKECNHKNCLYFNGNGGYVDIPNSLPFTQITLEASIYPSDCGTLNKNDNSHSSSTPLTVGVSTVNNTYFEYRNDCHFEFNLYDSNGAWKSVGTILVPGLWYHVIGTFDGTNQRLYVNGQPVASGTSNGMKLDNTNIRIGVNDPSSTTYEGNFIGKIDEVKIYNIALGSDEIPKYYNYSFIYPLGWWACDPETTTTIPIVSKFDQKILSPFYLKRDYDWPFREWVSYYPIPKATVSFDDEGLVFSSCGHMWTIARTDYLEQVNVLWVWKPLNGDQFITEAWINKKATGNENLAPGICPNNGVGLTCMIIFEPTGINYSKADETNWNKQLSTTDLTKSKDWIYVNAIVDYRDAVKKIKSLTITTTGFSQTWTDLPIGYEPTGSNVSWFQPQIWTYKNPSSFKVKQITVDPITIPPSIPPSQSQYTLTVDTQVDNYGLPLSNVRVTVDGETKYTPGYTPGHCTDVKFNLSPGPHTITVQDSVDSRPFSHFWDHDCYASPNYWLDTANTYTFQMYTRDKRITAWYKVLTNIDLKYSTSTSTISGNLSDEKGNALLQTKYYHPTCIPESSPPTQYPVDRSVTLEYYQSPNWVYIDTVTPEPDGSFSKHWNVVNGATKIRARYAPSNWFYMSSSSDIDLCSGTPYLTLNPSTAWTGQTVTATVSGLSGCNGKTAYVEVVSGSSGILRCWCTVPVSGTSCSCTFTAPPISGTMNYYAQIDMNGNGIYEPSEKSSPYTTLYISCDAYLSSCNNHLGVSSSNTCCGGGGYYCSSTGVCKFGSGGCPTLFVYDGKDYVKERKSNIHSEPGIDTVDDIVLTVEPTVVNGNYLLMLKETTLPEHSYIDTVRLIVTDSEGKKEAKLVSAKHSRYGDVTAALEKSDDVRTDTQVFDEIKLKFKGSELKGEASFIFKIEGYNPAVNILDRGISILGQVGRSGPYKMDIADFTVIAVVVAVIAIILVFGFFKFFARKK
jgi:hypothetical protein